MKSLFSRGNKENKRKPAEGSTLRQVNQLLREIKIIELDCGVKSKDDGKDSKLDKFQRAKIDFADLMKQIKDDVQTRKNLEEKLGETTETIKMKQKIQKDIQYAKDKHSEMERAYKDDEMKVNKQKKDALTDEELNERNELLGLFRQDLEYTEHQFKPTNEKTGGQFTLAREAREKRRKQRENGDIKEEEPRPLSENEQQFIQMSIKKDKQLESTLDEVLGVVKQIHNVAIDINEELDKQDVMIDELDSKMDNLQDKLISRNKQMKKLLEASGGAQRWCPIIVLLVILVALLGYIYNLATA